MGLSAMKEELHQRLWAAQERWFRWKAEGKTKHELKTQGLNDHGDMFAYLRGVILTGASRVAYERELKRFLQYAFHTRGRTKNQEVDRKDFRAYMEFLIEKGSAASELNKVKSAIVKLGALYGQGQSFSALSRKYGKKIRAMKRAGLVRPPERPHVTVEVREAIIRRLAELDRDCPVPRAYSLVVRLQKEASLRAIEATERFTRQSLVGMTEERGNISVLGKGGRVRSAMISRELYTQIESYFRNSSQESLAPKRAYQQALRRATLEVGGRSTGSHAHRRTSAEEKKNALYRGYVEQGLPPRQARENAVQDAVEHLGHSRYRRDSASAYLS